MVLDSTADKNSIVIANSMYLYTHIHVHMYMYILKCLYNRGVTKTFLRNQRSIVKSSAQTVTIMVT